MKHIALAALVLTAFGASEARAQTISSAGAGQPLLTGFGNSVAVSGDAVLVARTGTSQLLPLKPYRAGTVFEFKAGADGRWTQVASFTARDGFVGDQFGQAIAFSGNRALVTASAQDSTRGAAYIFERSADGWTQVARLTGSGLQPGDQFGNTAHLAGDFAFVAVEKADSSAGAVYVFQQTAGGAWNQRARLTASDGAPRHRFGHKIASDGDVLFVSAPGYGTNQGAVYVFSHDRSANTWTETTRLAHGDGSRTLFGTSLAAADGYMLIGTPAANTASGGADIFKRDEQGIWSRERALENPDGTPGGQFGTTLAFDGQTAWVGAPLVTGFAGAAYVFTLDRTDGVWSDAQKLPDTTPAQRSVYAGALGVSGNTAAVGIIGVDFGEGMVAIYNRSGTGKWISASDLTDEGTELTAVTGGKVGCASGRARVFDCSRVDLVSFLPTKSLGAGRGAQLNDIWGWTDPETGKEYAIVGRFDGTAFVDVSDPASPVYLGELKPTEGSAHNFWRDMKVYKNYAFIVADGAGNHGVQIFDLTQLRNVTSPPVEFAEAAHYNGIHSAHNIVINEETGFAYAVGSSMGGETCGGGLHMINIQDPLNPTFAGCFSHQGTGRSGTGYYHDAQCVVYRGPDKKYEGREICFGAAETALSIADVTDKENPVALASAAYPNVGYAHQGWITEDHKYFLMDDELDEIAGGVDKTRTLIWDITDLEDPVLLKEYFGQTNSSDHNLYIKGNLVYESNYVSGLRVLDITNIENPVEVGFFDTVPFGENTAGFGGSWSNYPFFKSGIVVVTSGREGLFVLKKQDVNVVP